MNRRTLKENCPKQPLTCVSGFWALVTFLFLNTVPAYAEWQAIEKDYLRPGLRTPDSGLRTVYVDPDSIRREGNLVTLWKLIDFQWMQGNQGIGPLGFGPHRFFSTKTHKQFDCAGKRLRLLAYIEFSHHMGTGIAANGYVDRDNWIPVEAESMSRALWEVACAGNDRVAVHHLRADKVARD